MDEREARERELLRWFLEGTPVEGDEEALDRLIAVGFRDRTAAVTLIAGGEASTVDEALAGYRERRNFYRDVQGDIDGL